MPSESYLVRRDIALTARMHEIIAENTVLMDRVACAEDEVAKLKLELKRLKQEQLDAISKIVATQLAQDY